jgi:hypothetical protein
LIFDRIDGITLGNVATLKNAVSVRCKALKQRKGTICLMHAQLVIHMNLYPGNVMPQCPQDEEIMEVTLIDVDAAMFSVALCRLWLKISFKGTEFTMPVCVQPMLLGGVL